MYGYIYKTTNLLNGKIYIGQKKSEKFLNEKYLGSGARFRSALKSYGKENFVVEIIDTAESSEELDKKEIYWIEKYDARNPDIGYNLSIGGGTTTGVAAWNKGMSGVRHHSQETRNKISQSHKGHPTSESTRKKMSKSNTGKKRTDEQREADRQRNLGKVWLHKGDKNTTVPKEKVNEYLQDGWERGRICNATAWNKGLTKETDERVRKYADKRKQRFANGEKIGCYGKCINGFKKGHVPWNKGLKHYNDGHPNYYHGKSKD